MKTNKLLVLALSAAALASCGGGSSVASSSSAGGNPGVSSSQPQVESSEPQEEAEAKIVHSFLTDAKLSYSNFRPGYNYYTTNFTFQVLKLFDDNTYALTISSSTFSAVILPEEGNAASGNERENSLLTFFGTYVSETDDLDDDALVIDLSAPTRLMGNDDSKGYLDTARWTSDMKTRWADKTYEYDTETGQQKETGSKEYATGGEYLHAHSIKPVEDIFASTKTGKMDYVELVGDTEGKATPITLEGEGEAYISDASLSYNNMRPTYNYYLTTFAFQHLDLLDDSTYALTLSSSTFSAVILPEEGNAASGNERENSLLTYYGTYSAVADDLDDSALVISISAPTRLVGNDDAKGFIDTDNWTDQMKANWADKTYEYDAETQQQKETGSKEYATGAEYLAAHSYKAVDDIYASSQTWKVDSIALDFGK